MGPRPPLTEGNVGFIRELHEAISAHFSDPASRKNILEKAIPYLRELQAPVGRYSDLGALGLVNRLPPRSTFKDGSGQAVDHSSCFEPTQGWTRLYVEDVVQSLGRAGPGAVATVGEALFVVNGLARTHGAKRVYYRGEHQYGWCLKSRAQRKMEEDLGTTLSAANGITKRELDELRRFQAEVRSGQVQLDEALVRANSLPDDDDPEWLPLMQHYDATFGTRLLDLTRSVFSGLYFACVDWDGTIDFATDGLLYVFLDRGRIYAYERGGDLDDEIAEFVPTSVTDAFKNWRHPEYLHHFDSSQRSMRELAQDGLYLVQGDIGVEPEFGGTAKFKLCIPHWAKARVIEELWFAGYTPERLVRGSIGKEAADKAESQLRAYRAVNDGWHGGKAPF